MIKENQQLLNGINVLSDGMIIYLMIPVAFWLRFSVLPNGVITVSLSYYLLSGIFFTLLQLYIFLAAGLYKPFRHIRLSRELERLFAACLIGFILLLSWFSLRHQDDYSRQMIVIYCVLSFILLALKRIALRLILRHYRSRGYNLKHVVLVGCGDLAEAYLNKILKEKQMGFHAVGYIAGQQRKDWEYSYLGGFEDLERVLEKIKPDDVVSAIEAEDYGRTEMIVQACEKTGCKLSIIPLYAEYMSARPQFDDLDGIPLLNVRRIPLENMANAFVKRAMDIVFSAITLIVFSPLMLICAVGVKLSSPGPIIFKQERIGRNKTPFFMYKFRSMRVNNQEDTGWSKQEDNRKTAFGSFIRKYSLDEFPQFWNVLKGDMSLVGPRPEIPYFVDQFKEKVPRYMLKHLVRPGITGWAQVNGLRGDTSIPERIRFDIWYIENWSIALDFKILFLTVFGGKFKNNEKLKK